jgi:hypothetical protein
MWRDSYDNNWGFVALTNLEVVAVSWMNVAFPWPEKEDLQG